MPNELKHADPGTKLTRTEFNAIDRHVLANQATGDLVYASSATLLGRLAIGATDDFLTIQGGVPVWSKAFDPVFVIGGNDTTSRVQRIRKARGTVAVPLVIVMGDALGDLSFEGYDGAAYEQAAVLRVISEGTIGAGRVPTKVSLLVNTDAAPSVLTERLSINSAGLITLPTATAAASGLVIGTVITMFSTGTGLVLSSTGVTSLDIGATNVGSGGSTLNMLGAPAQAMKTPLSMSAGNILTIASEGSRLTFTCASHDFLTGPVFFSGGAANGQRRNERALTELLTIAAAATSVTTIEIPLNAVVFAVSVRVTTVIPTAATFTVTGNTTGTQFDVAGGVAVAATTTDVGTALCPYTNGAAQTIRITPNLTPADNTGRVRVTIHYYNITPATS